MNPGRAVFSISIVIGLCIIGLDLYLDRFFFYGNTVSFAGMMTVPLNELFMRGLTLISFVIFGLVCTRLVTRLTKSEKEHADSAHFRQQLLDAIPVPIFYKDDKRVYLGCNKSFESFIGLSAAEIADKRVYDLVPEALAARSDAMDRQLLANPGVQIYREEIGRVDGSVKYVIFHKATFNRPDGTPAGLIGAILDITALQEAEQERDLIISDLREALGKVKLLSGFLPICASCKNIRNDQGYWQQIEQYLRENSEAQFSHSICPDCARKLYGDFT